MNCPSSSSVDEVGGRDALDGVEQGIRHLAGEGGHGGQVGFVFPPKRWLRTIAGHPTHIVGFCGGDVPQRAVDAAVGARPSGSQMVRGQLLAGGEDLPAQLLKRMSSTRVVSGWFSMLGKLL